MQSRTKVGGKQVISQWCCKQVLRTFKNYLGIEDNAQERVEKHRFIKIFGI